jgi:U3 small nucleolar RNA-associated protein 15
MYASVLGQSPLIDDLFTKLRLKIDAEITFQDELVQLQGSLDMLLVSNASLAQ